MPAAAGGGFDWRLLLSGLSSALPVIAQSRASKQAQGDLEAGQQEAWRSQSQADRMIGDEISDLRKSGDQGDETRTLVDYAGAVERNRKAASSGAPAPTLGGDRYQEGQKAASQQGQQYARQQATYAAGVDAPVRQRERESQSAMRTSSDVKALGQDASTAAFLARLRANRRQPNPWIALMSSLGSQVANNYIRPDEQLDPTGGAAAPPPQTPRYDPYMTGRGGK